MRTLEYYIEKCFRQRERIAELEARLDAVAKVQRHKFIEPLVDWDDKNNGATIYARHIKDDNGNWMKATDVLAALEQKDG